MYFFHLQNMLNTNTDSIHNPTLVDVILIVNYISLKCSNLKLESFQTCPEHFIHILRYKFIHPKTFWVLLLIGVNRDVLICKESNNTMNDQQMEHARHVGLFPNICARIVWSNITVGTFINEVHCWYDKSYLLYFYVGTNVWLISSFKSMLMHKIQ